MESARVRTADFLKERVMSAAMKSVLAEYYKPLYDEYHIFALDSGYGSSRINQEELNIRTQDYINCNLSSDYNKLILNDLVLKNINVNGYKTLLSERGELFWNEVIQYQKYRDVAMLAEELLKLAGLIEESDTVNNILLKQVETEEKLVKIDESMQSLMELIDGVQFKDGKIKRTLFTKKISTADKFTKRILNMPVTAENAGMNHPDLYASLSSKYVNVIEKTELMIEQIPGYVEKCQTYNELFADKLTLELEIKELNRKLDIVINNSESEIVKKEINDLKAKITEKEAELSEINARYNTAEYEYTKAYRTYNASKEILNELNMECKKKCEEALEVINTVKSLQGDAAVSINEFKDKIDTSKENLSEEIYDEFKTTLTWMDGYVSKEGDSLCIALDEAEKILNKQKNLLVNINSINFQSLPKTTAEENILLDKLNELKNIYSSYPSGLPYIDYQGLNVNESKDDGFLDSIYSLISSGAAGLILDEDSVSNVELLGGNLPTDWHNLYNNTDSSFSNILSSIKNSSVGALLSMNSLSDILDSAKNDLMNILGKVIFISYVEENFADYRSDNYESVLRYEKEYLLCGNLSDKENLNSIIVKILMIRFALNFLYLFSDSGCKSKAEVTAAAIVGFLGFPALIGIVKYLILTAWAMDAALVETAAIFNGKKIPFIVTSGSISVSYEEILLMSKARIRDKADKIKESKLGAGYKEYLWTFLLMTSKEKLCYRSMDLIQENIRASYEETFYMANCIVSYSVDADFILPQKFYSLPDNSEPYNYNLKKEISY